MRFRWIRWALLLAMLALGVWVALYLFGSAGRPTTPPPAPSTEIPEGLEGEVVGRGEGFEVGVYDGDQLVFLLEGETSEADSENNVTLEKVALEVTREGNPYRIQSEKATFSPEEKEAVLTGRVRLDGPDGLAVETEEVALTRKGRILTSQAPVAFAWGEGVLGRADSLRSDLKTEVYLLSGDVLVRRPATEAGDDAMELQANRISLDRSAQLLRADGRTEATLGRSSLLSRRIAAHLSDDGKRLRFLHASFSVLGTYRADGEAGSFREISIDSQTLSVLMEEDGKTPGEIEAEGYPGIRPVILKLSDETGKETVVLAPSVKAELRNGLPALVEAWGGVEIREGFTFDSHFVIRTLCAEAATATFGPTGDLGEIRLDDRVEYHEADMTMTGDEARVEQGGERTWIEGSPAVIQASRGRLTAPRFTYTRSSGVVRAERGVSTLLRDAGTGALQTTPLGGGEGPLFVESEEAFLQPDRSFSFRGKVKAWREDSLLTADQLRGDDHLGELSAAGSVRTVWTAPEGSAVAGTIEVTADELAYRSEENVLVYSGDVVAVQEGRRMTCDETSLRLRENAGRTELDWMECVGHAHLEESATGRRAEAERIVYRPQEGIIVLTGNPVDWSDQEGHQLKGRRIVYELENGAVSVRSEVSSAGPGG